MNVGQLEKTSSPVNGKKHILFYVSAFFILFVLFALVYLTILLNSDTIYKGVQIRGTAVHGFNKEELSAYLEDELASLFVDLSVNLDDLQSTRTIDVSEMGLKIDIEAMVQQAYSLGRKGNILDRLINIAKIRKSPVTIDFVLDSETEKFNNLLNEICDDVFREIIPTNIVIMEDQVILCTGTSGQQADKEQLKKEIISRIIAFDSSVLIIPIVKIPPPPLDIETTLSTLNSEPINAEFVRTSRTTYEIKPHQMGLKLDRGKLMEIMSYIENRENKEYEEIIIPVEFIYPEITEDELKAQLFRDTLSSYTTHFSTNSENNYNRSINIGLAADSIDGTLLLPGEIFSFNDVVGPRTAQKGYRTAHVFVAGKITDGTGGGVCQVSTTLYNAVLRANLEVSERHNHMFTVGYVPLGHDAAVSYGYADLVFKNTTSYPLRINATVSQDNNLTFKISSTNDYPNQNVKLATKTISTTPISVQYIDDNTLPQGTVVVDENGMEGYVVDTYIRIYNGDVLIKEEKLHRSVYQMYPKKIKRGTSPVF